MLIWLTLAIFIAVAALIIAWPFLSDTDNENIDVFDPQTQSLKTALEATDRDEALGIMNALDAVSERATIASEFEARPLNKRQDFKASKKGIVVSFCAIGLLSVIAFASYSLKGTPDFRDQPLAWRIETFDDVKLAHNLEKLEDHLAKNPTDGEGWVVIAPVYFSQQRWDLAARSYLSAVNYGAFSTKQQSEYLTRATESLLNASGGEFTPQISNFAAMAERTDPSNPAAAFLNGLAIEKNETANMAIANWHKVIERFPNDGQGLNAKIQDRIKELSLTTNGAIISGPTVPNETPKFRGPTEDQIRDAQSMSEDDRRAMINAMVDGLALRLEDDPGDIDGWERLMKSYSVLGDKDAVIEAYDMASKIFAEDVVALNRLNAVAKTLEITP